MFVQVLAGQSANVGVTSRVSLRSNVDFTPYSAQGHCMSEEISVATGLEQYRLGGVERQGRS